MRFLSARFWPFVLIAMFIAPFLRGEEPTTKPAEDATLDWLMDQATPAPVKRPKDTDVASTQPALMRPDDKDGFRWGTVTLSDGEKVNARLGTTPDRPIRIFDIGKQEFRDIPWSLIDSMEAKILWEREEREWKFVESGSDIREYSGKTYPAREIQYTIKTTNGKTYTGGISAPVYVETMIGTTKLLVLYKRQKGEVGETLKDIAYVQHIQFKAAPPASTTRASDSD